MGHIWTIFHANFGGNRWPDAGFRAKNWNANRSLNSSDSKATCARRIKVSNLEASGHTVSAPPKKTMTIPTLFFSLFISANYFLVTKTTKPPKLETCLYIKLCICNFGGARLRGLGQMHPKLVIAKFIKWFYSHTPACCRGCMVKGASTWNLRPGFICRVRHRFCQTKIVLILAYYIFFN